MRTHSADVRWIDLHVRGKEPEVLLAGRLGLCGVGSRSDFIRTLGVTYSLREALRSVKGARREKIRVVERDRHRNGPRRGREAASHEGGGNLGGSGGGWEGGR